MFPYKFFQNDKLNLSSIRCYMSISSHKKNKVLHVTEEINPVTKANKLGKTTPIKHATLM